MPSKYLPFLEYDYKPLLYTDSVRFLKVSPGLPIRCKLVQCRLSQQPKYEAVSYTWGTMNDVKPIKINKRRFLVGSNLYEFLEQLCLQGQRRKIWCDAICINQNAVNERNHQVRLMGDIYKNAALVLVWLGPEADNSQFIFHSTVISQYRHGDHILAVNCVN